MKNNSSNNCEKVENTSSIKSFEDIPEAYQEYLETICLLSLNNEVGQNQEISNLAIANKMQIKPSSVSNMLKKLSSKKLIEWEPRTKKIKLTQLGEKLGRRIIINHLIIESFIENTLKITDPILSHKIACELEHHIKKPIYEAFKEHIDSNLMNALNVDLENKTNINIIKSKLSNLNMFPEFNIEDFIDQFISFILNESNLEKKLNISKDDLKYILLDIKQAFLKKRKT